MAWRRFLHFWWTEVSGTSYEGSAERFRPSAGQKHETVLSLSHSEILDPDGRVWSKVDVSGDCWEWTAARNTDGYGSLRDLERDTVLGAHRLIYEALVGPVPVGQELDHLCRTRHCVNPDHLRIVFHSENVAAGAVRFNGQYQRTKTHCPQGHPYDEINTRIDKRGARRCKTCNNERVAAWRAVDPERARVSRRKSWAKNKHKYKKQKTF